MIPLRDENPSESTPVVTRLLIVVNLVLFVYELVLGPDLRAFMMEWGFVPRRLTAAWVAGAESVLGPTLTLVSSMFLHGGWAHVLGNLWYLWIFGDNVEDQLGHARFLGFYLIAGVCSALVHYATNASSALPTVGASGAIAGVLGAYLVAFPRARVITLVPLFPFFQVMALPAALVLGLWFVFQFFSGALSLAWTRAGGVAWWAHIGGFAFGFVAMKVLAARRRPALPSRWA
jgi:membrane associated rhomboid family serine protease